MNYVEYGKENNDVIILLHGGGLSWWNYKDTCAISKSDMIVFLQENSVYSLKDGIGEFSINHADDYVRKLLEIVKQR